ncbi:hypothetical protein [Gilvibacter sp.]|uniref:hypothetical protein n=1 Tax=Gilvibacter sp. TaxID=2729997 RepID=UPI0025C1746C|nr:hypothetical protein [Gilvibacter sp.]NQX78875.1 hypothetical protein [Gilvibacter sp.]
MKRVKDKLYSINLNQYRNWHPMVENKVKKQYSDDLEDQLSGLTFNGPITLDYQVFKPTRARLDKMNVIAITSKYFQDALVNWECIPDDNDDFIKDEFVRPTIYDKNNGRVEITIKTIN